MPNGWHWHVPSSKKLLELWSNVSSVTCKWPKTVHYWAILDIFSCTLGYSTSYVAVFPHYKDSSSKDLLVILLLLDLIFMKLIIIQYIPLMYICRHKPTILHFCHSCNYSIKNNISQIMWRLRLSLFSHKISHVTTSGPVTFFQRALMACICNSWSFLSLSKAALVASMSEDNFL